MTTRLEIQFELQRALLEAYGREPVQLLGIHSIVTEGDVVHVNYDVRRSCGDEVFPFEFELSPATLIGRDDLRAFSDWLAAQDFAGTAH